MNLISLEQRCRAAVTALMPRVRIQGVEYLVRDETYEIRPDFSVRVERSLELRWTGREPLHCFETGCHSDAGSPLEGVEFSVKVADQSGRTVFVLPDINSSQPTHHKFIVGLMPPLEKRFLRPGFGKVRLVMTWTWPNWWTRLRDAGKDTVEVNIDHATRAFRFTLRHHFTMKVTANDGRNSVPESNNDGDYCWIRWTYPGAPDGKYIFTCEYSPDKGSDAP